MLKIFEKYSLRFCGGGGGLRQEESGRESEREKERHVCMSASEQSHVCLCWWAWVSAHVCERACECVWACVRASVCVYVFKEWSEWDQPRNVSFSQAQLFLVRLTFKRLEQMWEERKDKPYFTWDRKEGKNLKDVNTYIDGQVNGLPGWAEKHLLTCLVEKLSCRYIFLLGNNLNLLPSTSHIK